MEIAVRIAAVYVWEQEPEPMVMVFEEFGNQVPELQGRLSQVKEKVLAALDEQTEILGAKWRIMDSLVDLTREEFAAR